MTESQLTAIRELRHQGYAVVVFTPDELRGATPKHVESGLVEHGWQVIEALVGPELEDDAT